MKNKCLNLLSLAVVLAMSISACSLTAPKSQPVELTFWYWGEDDAPGADAWLAESVAAYKQVKPNVTVTVVKQSSDTLISGFQTAVSAKSGPDIASQWATGPVLGFVWQDALVPVSDYVPASEMQNWLNIDENKYNGKYWGAPIYLISIDFMYNKDLFAKAGVTAPASGQWTWAEFTAACDKLIAAGITPFVTDDKTGYGGAWWWSIVGTGNLNSTEELRQAVIGNKPFTDDVYTGWFKTLDDMVKKGYFNKDVMSLDIPMSGPAFGKGQGAMAWGTDGMVKQAMTDLGADKVGVMLAPKWGTGKLADAGDATQSTSYLITKWSKHPQDAADFLVYLHTPDRMTSWYKHTGVVFADKRFDRSLVTDPVLKQLMEWETGSMQQVWVENYLPGQIDGDGDLPAGELIFSQSGSPADAAALWEKAAETWRSQHPDELKNWQNWQP